MEDVRRAPSDLRGRMVLGVDKGVGEDRQLDYGDGHKSRYLPLCFDIHLAPLINPTNFKYRRANVMYLTRAR